MPKEQPVMPAQNQPQAYQDAATKYGVAPNGVGDRLAALGWLAPVIIAAVVLAAYAVAVAIPPLLDEQFYLRWTADAGRQTAPLDQYLMWNGFSEPDLWGPATGLFNKLGYILSVGWVPLLRIQGIVWHAATAVLLYFSARRLSSVVGAGRLMPLCAAILFAAYPINAEAVAWLGGRGLLLAGGFFAASIYSYLRGRGIGANDGQNNANTSNFDWRWIMASFGSYAVALLCSSALWSASLVFGLIELWLVAQNKQTDSSPGARKAEDLTVRVLGPLACVFVAATYIAANGTIWQLTSVDIGPHLVPAALLKTMKALFFPINEAIWHKYAYAYDILYVLFPPFVALFAWSAIRSAAMRSLIGLFIGWFAISLFPEIGHIAKENLFGSRLFYVTAMPLSCMLATIFCGAQSALPERWRGVGNGIAIFGAAAMAIFYLAHITNQNLAWRNGGRQIAAVQKSLAVVQSRTNAPYLLACDVPEWVTVSPAYSTRGLVVFDGKTRLLSAGTVSPGKLKDALRDGKYRDVTLAWVEDLRSFMPVDASGNGEPLQKLDAQQLATRFVPGIEFFKSAHLDAAQNSLVLESNNDRGPAMRVAATGLSPDKDDFLYIDATVEAPLSEERPLIELYWQTGTHTDYNNKTRKAWTKAILDGKQHRYLLPLRTLGWVDSGPLFTLTFGFPAGSKVTIKEMGVTSETSNRPTFDIVASADQSTQPQYDPPYYNFPNLPELGLYRQPQSTQIISTYDASANHYATGASIEISMPNKKFPNPNGNEPSGVGGKAIVVDGSAGSASIQTANFPRSAVYSMRAIAIDKKHEFSGNFSDSVYCLVRTPRKTAWVEQLQ